jgi:hypothetical protein
MPMLHPILAYIDPGTGSLIIQVLIASIVAIPVILRHRIAQVARILRREESIPEAPEGEGDGPAAG